MHRKSWIPIVLLGILLLAACASRQSSRPVPSLLSDSLRGEPRESATQIVIQAHQTKPTPAPDPHRQRRFPTPIPSPITSSPVPIGIPGSGSGPAPYGPPPAMTAEEIQLTQQLFQVINSDRAAQGLYPYTWNATLAGGARLHSWNMFHCGFSHTCPDGISQCQRIANEGFPNNDTCGENIAYAGPFPTPWQGVHTIQESMANEPPTGWHHIHLFSTTLHSIGVGVYVDPSGYIWFTEDMIV